MRPARSRLLPVSFTVKDSKRCADTGGWGYFNFNHHEPKAPTAKLKPKSECGYCHMANAKKDEVWTQFYPLLDSVTDEGDCGADGAALLSRSVLS